MEIIAACRGPIQSASAPVPKTHMDPAPQARPMTIPEPTAALSGSVSCALTTMEGITAIPKNPATQAAEYAGRVPGARETANK